LPRAYGGVLPSSKRRAAASSDVKLYQTKACSHSSLPTKKGTKAASVEHRCECGHVGHAIAASRSVHHCWGATSGGGGARSAQQAWMVILRRSCLS